EVKEHENSGPLRFQVRCDRWPQPIVYEVKFGKNTVDYQPATTIEPSVQYGRKKLKLSEYFQIEPPFIRFHDGSFLDYDYHYPALRGPRESFDRARIDVWPWTGVDLKKESQTQKKIPNSIQRHVIDKL